MKKKFISALMLAVMLVNTLPARVSAASTQDALDWLYAQSQAYYDLDSRYGAQCSDLVTAYMNWLIDGTPYSGRYAVYNANYYPTVAGWHPDRWEVIPNTPEFIPRPGDIFVTKGGKSYGHTGIVLSSTVSHATVIDQNSVGSNETYGAPAYIHDIVWSGSYEATYFIRFRGYTTPAPSVSCAHSYLNCVEAAHPHKTYRYCIDCGDTQYTGETQKSASCQECNPTVQPPQWGQWSSWSEASPETKDGRQIESREVVTGYNLVVYVTQEASYPYRRNFRNYSVNGNYGGFGLRSSYGEFAYRRYASKAELEAAAVCQPGSYIYQDAGHVGGCYRGDGQAYYFPDGYYWYIESSNTVTEYRYRDALS